ncbi:PEP-CTERM sorting domain-containing protein [Methylophilus sp. DW102]|uniref:PEP-CTERM sorting domain-containing protein n=1 Tax=Methylophilus sp. DW102 TaxID=3095607 RepID=UPI00308BB895|nr:PEP-CTERM sorting domain-containing protein [Methylophilus sp. DW102]
MKLAKFFIATSLLWSAYANAAFSISDADPLNPGSNDSFSTAQSAFTLLPGNEYKITGDITANDIDFYKIIVGSASPLVLNIKLSAPNMNPGLGLYDVGGNLLSYDTETGGTQYAAILNYVLNAGTYFVSAERSVSNSPNFAYSITLDVPGVNPVPEPESVSFLALGIAVIGLVVRRRSK